MRDLGLPELPGARFGSGEPKMHDFGLPELPVARFGSGEPKMHDFGLLMHLGARPGSGEPKMRHPAYRSFKEPGLAPVNRKCVTRLTGAARSQAWLR